jgi:hypothetical protein
VTRDPWQTTGTAKDAHGHADLEGVSRQRVLCYSPYNRWALHGRWEMTILQALKLRGAEVDYVLCDGLFTDCDQFWEAVAPRPSNACTICQMQVTSLVASMGMDFHWLGRYLTTDEGREARRWAHSLPTEDLLSATYGDWRVGEWVRSSVQSHFRSSHLDISDPLIERGMRSYVYSGLIACFALDRLLAESAPDVLLLFNGRQSSTRVALELARARGIRVIVHERGLRKETLMLVENATCASLEPSRRYWREWGEVPLTHEELGDITHLMGEREHGRDTGWNAFTAAPQPLGEVATALGLRSDRPLWVLFTSSDDEVAGDDDHRSPFVSQLAWIEQTVEHARRNPQIDLVIRVHPNTGSRRSSGANRDQLEQMRRLGESLPPNVRMIDPDDEISSYPLMDLCSVGLVWVSTVGLELACKGKSVVVAAGNRVAGTSFVHTVQDSATYDELLASLNALEPGAVSAEIRRLALRFAYGIFFRLRIDFPLVKMPTPQEGRLAYDSLDALAPGRDAGVDRCARIILEGESVCPPPAAIELARSTETEDAFLQRFGERHLTVLAFADELIADDSLLEAWAETFEGRHDVTLLIHTPVASTPGLVESVTRAGLDREDGPALVADDLGPDGMAAVDAVFSRVTQAGPPATAPRYEPTSLPELISSLPPLPQLLETP